MMKMSGFIVVSVVLQYLWRTETYRACEQVSSQWLLLPRQYWLLILDALISMCVVKKCMDRRYSPLKKPIARPRNRSQQIDQIKMELSDPTS